METGLFSTRRLRAHGLSTADIRRALRNGTLARVRRGWYAVPNVTPDVLTAARIGGRLSCVTALRWHGAWTLDRSNPHVRVASGVDVRRLAEPHLHWTEDRVGPGVDTVETALGVATTCLDFRALVVLADSLANRRLLSPDRLAAVLTRSARGRRALTAHDPRAESGIETLVRLALRRRRVSIRSQVVIPGVGRVDFLVGDRLVIETDGFEWHGGRDAFERDRQRDLELVRLGYVVIRASYRRVIDDLDGVVMAVLDVVRRRDHRWRAVHRTQLSGSGYLVGVSSPDSRNPES